MKAAYNLPALASVFTDKSILDCSQIILQFSLFLEDNPVDGFTSKTPSTSTADTSPINNSSILGGENFNFLIMSSKKTS
jgi:hypothetical protein